MVTVSEAALSQLKTLVASSEPGQKVGLRVFVQDGGCSGFSYGMGLDENPPRPDDDVAEFEGLAVYVDGAEIDYVDALMGGGFTVNNPQAVKTCGCGHSFQTADQAGTAKSCSA
jgi:iron-sulfur cluster assembly protein